MTTVEFINQNYGNDSPRRLFSEVYSLYAKQGGRLSKKAFSQALPSWIQNRESHGKRWLFFGSKTPRASTTEQLLAFAAKHFTYVEGAKYPASEFNRRLKEAGLQPSRLGSYIEGLVEKVS